MPTLEAIERAFWACVWRCTHASPCDVCCWPWRGPGRKASKWHPSVLDTAILQYPHRFALILEHGAGLLPTTAPHLWFVVCHRCDFPPCCNPAHLWVGTQGDNVRDAQAKGWFRSRRERQYIFLPDGTSFAA
jgi:HNH endonuclease